MREKPGIGGGTRESEGNLAVGSAVFPSTRAAGRVKRCGSPRGSAATTSSVWARECGQGRGLDLGLNAKCNPLRRSRDACNQGFPQRNSDSDFLSFTRLLIILLQSGDLAGCFCLIYVLLPFLSFLSFSVSPLFYVVIRF